MGRKSIDPTWATEAWTGTDQPYSQIRANIEQSKKKGYSLASLASQHRAASRNKPNDPVAAFRWGYALYLGALSDRALMRSAQYEEVMRALGGVSSPHSYEFARLQFLLEALGSEPRPHLKTVGKRLLQREPNDNRVKYLLVHVLDPGLYQEDKELALAYCQDLIKAMPDKPQVYGLLGGVYLAMYWRSKETATRDKAIAAYQKYLELSSHAKERRYFVPT